MMVNRLVLHVVIEGLGSGRKKAPGVGRGWGRFELVATRSMRPKIVQTESVRAILIRETVQIG